MSQQLANGEVDFLGPNNRTPLHLAVLGNHSHIVELLVLCCLYAQEIIVDLCLFVCTVFCLVETWC